MASISVPSNPKAKSITSTSSVPARVDRLAVLGPPWLVEREDDAAYEELLVRICVAVKPVDAIEEIFVADLVFLQWEVLGLRRLKTSLMKASTYEALKDFLPDVLPYDLFVEEFEEALAEALQENLRQDQDEDFARKLAHQCVHDEPGACQKFDELLEPVGRSTYTVYQVTKKAKVEHLARGYARREPEAIKQVNELLTTRGVTMHDITTKPLMRKIDDIERIDKLIDIAETRRNVSLREIERRRAVLGEALRRTVQEVEDAEFEVIETPRVEEESAV
jgi:hypothetical protein